MTCHNRFHDIHRNNRIDDFRTWGGKLKTKAFEETTNQALSAARQIAEKMCDRSRENSQSGNYDDECGKCNSVKISVTCDGAARKVFEEGIGPPNVEGGPPIVLKEKPKSNPCGRTWTHTCLFDFIPKDDPHFKPFPADEYFPLD